MTVDTKNLVSMTEANQNFSRVARMVDECGSVVILKNNAPRYLLIEFAQAERAAAAEDDLAAVSARIMDANRQAYEVLAQ